MCLYDAARKNTSTLYTNLFHLPQSGKQFVGVQLLKHFLKDFGWRKKICPSWVYMTVVLEALERP